MANHTTSAFWVAFVGIVGSQAVVAQRVPSVVVDVGQCIGVEAAAERFACYEAQVGNVLRRRAAEAAPTEPPAAAPAARAATAAPVATTAPSGADGGASTPRDSATRSSRRNDRRDFTPEEFEGTVAALRESVPNSWVITLENGQVWRQTRPLSYPLRTGHKVRIYSTRWGTNFRLTADDLNGFIQVELVE